MLKRCLGQILIEVILFWGDKAAYLKPFSVPEHIIMTDFNKIWQLFPLNMWNNIQVFKPDRLLKPQTVSLIEYVLFHSVSSIFF